MLFSPTSSCPSQVSWPFTLRDPLPVVVVPLTQGHRDIALNLPAIFQQACRVLDLGPEGGDGGGVIVATGTPEDIAKCETSHTGRYLKKIL